MLTLSPQVGELLLQATQSQDLEEALQKVLRDYVDLKLAALSAEISRLEGQWGCPFAEFQEKTKGEYTYEVESTFWEWERLETLKSHYQVTQRGFLEVYFNERTQTVAVAWIEAERRRWGIDRDNLRGWHRHPLENPEDHQAIPAMSIHEIIKELGEV